VCRIGSFFAITQYLSGQLVPQWGIVQGRTSSIGMHGDTQQLHSSIAYGGMAPFEFQWRIS
jgi:hypothetical protein